MRLAKGTSLVVQLGLLCFASLTHGDAQSAEKRAVSKVERAVVREKVTPDYTPEARAAGLQGSVILYVEISAAGQAEKIDVIQSLGMGLDEKAIDAVQHWNFAAGTRDGSPVNVQQSVEVQFILPDGSWRVKRCYYQVHRGGLGNVKRLSEPLLTAYAIPPAQACLSSAGSATVSLGISKDGSVLNPTLVSHRGAAIGDSALQSVSGWVFRPGTINGKPKEASGVVELECNALTSGASEDDPNAPVYKASGTDVVSPKLISKVEPEYSNEARNAHLSGISFLSIVVDESGHSTKMLVTRPLGLGLDEKAMQAVSQWRFKPGEKDGKPVSVRATVEIQFRLVG